MKNFTGLETARIAGRDYERDALGRIRVDNPAEVADIEVALSDAVEVAILREAVPGWWEVRYFDR